MPPVMINVAASDALQRGIKNTFSHTWRRRYDLNDKRVKSLCESVPSDKYKELYAYPETAPYVRRRPYGEPISVGTFRFRSWEVENLGWGIGVTYDESDALYDQTQMLINQSKSAGESFGGLKERVSFQIITGATDANLLPAIPNAPDGAAMYSATDGGGANRFGVSGGNLLTGNGVGSGAVIRSDFFNAIELFHRFQDPEGQPALDAGIIDQGVHVYFNASNLELFSEAFLQARTALASPASPSNAAVTNTIGDVGYKITLWPTQRITDNDWYIVLDGADPKPLVEQIVVPVLEGPQLAENSDLGRIARQFGWFWATYRGYGVNLPLFTVKVNN